ncbi:MAG: hypothetical protein P4L74_07090 [Candidatus Doudnabacteria bacterium]|nr:hypothetical protein [Candidatus Doudnabacteria bacterium]
MKTKRNLDGIQNQSFIKPAVKVTRRFVKIDSVVKNISGNKRARPQANRTVFVVPPLLPSRAAVWQTQLLRSVVRQRVPLVAAVLALFLAFAGGIWFVLDTSRSSADTGQPQVLGASTSQPSAPIVMTNAELPQANTVSNSVIFNTPIEYLKQYLEDVSQPDVIAKRTGQIKEFLQQRNSPLASAAATIASQPHWNMIMAVAFAESSLGKNCSDNNCSNIGVKPGAPSWRRYASYDAWVVDFNRLLDKRYKDWTLQEMCGVYVKPCNPNWLLATQQIFDALQEEHIE